MRYLLQQLIFFAGTISVCAQPFSPNDIWRFSGSIDYSIPPTNNFFRATNNPFNLTLQTANGNCLPENMLLNTNDNLYYMVAGGDGFSGSSTQGIFFLTNSSPLNAAGWNMYKMPYTNNGGQYCGPHYIQGPNGYWYLFYSTNNTTVFTSIMVASNSSPSAALSSPKQLITTSGGTWESFRVLEPYVFQKPDSTWVMLYCGDTNNGTGEQIGYATASSIDGPYTKYGSNPLISRGAAGTFDAGVVADPWCAYWNGTYYIGYASQYTTNSGGPAQTAMVTTTDFVNITKLGVIFPTNSAAGWDSTNTFRGAVTQVGRNYILPYTGSKYLGGIASCAADYAAPNVSSVVSTVSTFPPFVTFNTDIPANCGIEWGTSSLTYTVTNAETTIGRGGYTHIASLTGSGLGTTVYYKIIATNVVGGGLITNAGEYTLSLNTNMSSSLVLWLPMNDGVSTLNDYSGNANNATLTSGNWSNTVYGVVPALNGSSAFATMGSVPSISAGVHWSISLWWTASNASLDSYLYGDMNSGGSTPNFGLDKSSSTVLKQLYNNSFAPSTVGITFAANTWYHVVITSESKLYTNGVLNASSSALTNQAWSGFTGSAMRIGKEGDFSTPRYWNGFINRFRVYNRALSANDASYLYSNGM